jgi:hypothetical protein
MRRRSGLIEEGIKMIERPTGGREDEGMVMEDGISGETDGLPNILRLPRRHPEGITHSSALLSG